MLKSSEYFVLLEIKKEARGEIWCVFDSWQFIMGEREVSDNHAFTSGIVSCKSSILFKPLRFRLIDKMLGYCECNSIFESSEKKNAKRDTN